MAKHDLITAETVIAGPVLPHTGKTKIQRVLRLPHRWVTLQPSKGGVRVPHKLNLTTRMWLRVMVPMTKADREIAAKAGVLVPAMLRARIALSAHLSRNIPCGQNPLLVGVQPDLVVSTRGTWVDARAEYLFPA